MIISAKATSWLRAAAFGLALAAKTLANPAFAEDLTSGTCAIPSNAPTPVAKALDQVLQRIFKPSPETLPEPIKKLYTPDFGAAPGAVLSVQGPGWRYIKAVGVADIEKQTPLDCGLPFEIGSNTKMMTTTILLQLQEEGKLSIDDPLSRFLPDIAAQLPNGRALTLRHLAQHTSGVFDYADNSEDGTPGILAGGATDANLLKRQVEPQEMIDFVVRHGKPHFAPGDKNAWSYSNTGYILLGMVIEKIEGVPLEKSLDRRIFEPLGMDHTFLWRGIPRPAFGLPRSWLQAPFDHETTDWNLSQGWAAGGVISTADDMHRFIEPLLGGKLFKSPQTLALMEETVSTGSPLDLGYGIGLKLIDKGQWGHGGQTLGFLSSFGGFPAEHISYIAWSNSSSNIIAFGDMLIRDALKSSGAALP